MKKLTIYLNNESARQRLEEIAKIEGENFHGDGDICKIEEIVAIFDKKGNRIEA